MKLKLITVPNPFLRQKSKPIEKMDTEITQFLDDLGQTLLKMSDPPGVGLSAVQVGRLLRAFYTYLPPIYDINALKDDAPASELKLFLNPQIVSQSDKMTFGPDPDNPALEGCLSVPALYGPVPRHQSITIKYLTYGYRDAGVQEFAHGAGPHEVGASTHNSDSESRADKQMGLVEKTDVFSNFYARVIQHEYDHLEGILFTDYTKKDHQNLYFDQGNKLIEIPKPNEIIQW